MLSAFEFLDRQALLLTKRHLDINDPLPHTEAPFNVIIETSGSNAEHDMAKLEVRSSAVTCRMPEHCQAAVGLPLGSARL